MRRPLRALFAALALVGVVALAPATPARAAPTPLPIDTPGSTSQVRMISTTTRGGWRYDSYRNTAYVCAISGFNTFTIATKVGTPDDAVRPLWVFLHGGGVGYFRPDGSTNGAGQKTEESPATQIQTLERGGLLDRIEAAPAGFRIMAVSMCNHDIYAGSGLADPYNPNRKPDGSPRTVDGLFATKAAIQHALRTRPTDDFFLHGGSAGSFGSFGVAWALEEQGLPPAGVVGDSGVLFREWQVANADSPECGREEIAGEVLQQRLHPEIIDPDNDPAQLVADGRLTVPLVQVWSIGDPGQCGTTPMTCPVAGSPTLGSVDCMHEPLRQAIDAHPGDRSRNLRLCVDNPNLSGECDRHVPTMAKGVANTLPGSPADYLTTVMTWVSARLADDGSTPSADRTPAGSFVTAALTDLLGEADQRRVEAGVHALVAGQPRRSFLRELTTSDQWLAAVIGGLYQDTLGRPGEPAGVAFWVEQLRSGRRSVAQVAASFYASAEYHSGIGGGTDETWITDLYVKVLGRSPDAAGLAYWVGQAEVAGRTSVAYRIYQSPESARTRVSGLYEALLGRSPDPSGLSFWSARVVREGDLALAVDLAASPEYAGRAEVRFP